MVELLCVVTFRLDEDGKVLTPEEILYRVSNTAAGDSCALTGKLNNYYYPLKLLYIVLLPGKRICGFIPFLKDTPIFIIQLW